MRTSGTRVDFYELLDHLGDGSHAEVHRAKDLRDGSEVVIKFPLAKSLDHPVLAARWRREAAITKGLRHRGIVCRLDDGQRHCEPYVVLEYAEGGDLRGWVSSADNPLPIRQALVWGRQLAEALAFLHDSAVIHRDLKPENILVTGELAIKLGDFGTAIPAEHNQRSFFAMPVVPEGTAEYLSPEQIIGAPSDQRSDIYGWGVVMYELLTGQVPFRGTDALAAMTAHLQQQLVPVRTLRPDVSPALEAVVMTAMRRHPEHRYPDARALLADLDRLDTLDPKTFDLGPEDAVTTPVGGHETAAVFRLAVVTLAAFLSLVTVAITFSAVLH